jgi:hypothetical protein
MPAASDTLTATRATGMVYVITCARATSPLM